MNRKLTLILTLLILAAVSVSIATAVNDTQDTVEADDSSSDDEIAVEDTDEVQTSKDTEKLADGGLTIEKVWKDKNDEAGKRPSSIKFAIIVNGQEAETGKISESMSWNTTLNLAVDEDSNYEVVEKDVPDGYEAKVTGNVKDGFVITNTLKDVPKNDTDKNTTPKDNGTGKNATAKKDPDSRKPSNTGPKQVITVSSKTTTKETPVKNETKNDTKNDTKEPSYLYNAGNPIIIGVVAVALAAIAYALYRRK